MSVARTKRHIAGHDQDRLAAGAFQFQPRKIHGAGFAVFRLSRESLPRPASRRSPRRRSSPVTTNVAANPRAHRHLAQNVAEHDFGQMLARPRALKQRTEPLLGVAKSLDGHQCGDVHDAIQKEFS